MSNARLTATGIQVLDAGGTPNARLSAIGAQVLALDPDFVPVPGVFRLVWEEGNGATSYRIYYSLEPMDPLSLPTPVETVDSTVTSLNWTNAGVIPGASGYFRVEAVSGEDTELSAEVELRAEPHYRPFAATWRANVTIALVVNDANHGATTNTRQALLDAGFADANITVALDSSTPPAADVIVICRGCATQTEVDRITPAWAAGTPVIWGSSYGFQVGTGNVIASTLARLTGTFRGVDTTVVQNYTSEDVLTRDHAITLAYQVSNYPIVTAKNWGLALDTGQPFVGERLGNAAVGTNNIGGQATYLAVDAGTPDLDGNPTPARSVVWSNLYGGQSTYTEAGRELIARAIEWCLEYPHMTEA